MRYGPVFPRSAALLLLMTERAPPLGTLNSARMLRQTGPFFVARFALII
jgi:hypothetical protein